MKKQAHASNRAQRRAAERAALKAARKNERQAIAANAQSSSLLIPFNIPPTENSMQNTTESETPKSPGPRTDAGKQISARNAISHGLCAVKTLILPNESFSDYSQLESRWLQTYRINPHGDGDPVKAELARLAARAEWFYLRAERNYSDTEAKLLTENPDMSTWTEEQHQQLSRVMRYRTANGNILGKHRKELESHIKARNAEATFIQHSKDKDEKLAMARERLEVFRQKNKPFDLAEELEAMKQKAIRLGFRQPDPEPDQPTGN